MPFVYGLGLIARIQPDNTAHYYHYDSRGSTVALTDAAENVTDSYAYDPFGNPVAATGSNSNQFRYLGRHGVSDEGGDLNYIRARYYDTEQQRFVSKDPYLGVNRRTQTMNRYAYALNSPVRYIDVSGFKSETIASGTSLLRDYIHPTISALLSPPSVPIAKNVLGSSGTKKVVPIAPGTFVRWEYCLGWFVGTCEERIVGRDNEGNGYFTSTGSFSVLAGPGTVEAGGGLRRQDPNEGTVSKVKFNPQIKGVGSIDVSAEVGKPGLSGLSVAGTVSGIGVSPDEGIVEGELGVGAKVKVFTNSKTWIYNDEEIFYDLVFEELGLVF